MKSIKEKINIGAIIKNGWISNANLLSCEIFSLQATDSITIDLQHSLTDYATC